MNLSSYAREPVPQGDDHSPKPTLLALALLLLSGSSLCGNPIASGVGLADPHVVIYGDRAYLYATHDFSPNNQQFVTKDWWVWSSTDLANWTQVGLLDPEHTFLHRPSNDCWAGFGATRNGKYYWYFSAGQTEIGVVVGDSPVGPWKDPLGKPLVANGLTPTEQRDPDILMDDDGQAYLVYGTFKYFVARLSDDMISLAEPPRRLKLDREFGPYGEGKTDDKPSLHKRNGVYYLSWSSFYATATNVYGPYTYRGSVIERESVAPEFRMDDGRNEGLRHDRHGNFFTWHNQWYYACNDKSQPGRTTHFRDSCISYVHYRDNGDIAPIRLDSIGVGRYDAAQSRIEAEDFFDAEHADIRETPAGGFEVRGLRNGSRLVYPNVAHLAANTTLAFSVASIRPDAGTIEIHERNETGKLLGTCPVPSTRSLTRFQIISCRLNNPPGTHDLCLVFRGGPGELMRLDWLKFDPTAP